MGRANTLFEPGELTMFRLRPGQSATQVAEELGLQVKSFHLLRANPVQPLNPWIVGQIQGGGCVGIDSREEALLERASELMEPVVSLAEKIRRWIAP